jgi:hypothetical protein
MPQTQHPCAFPTHLTPQTTHTIPRRPTKGNNASDCAKPLRRYGDKCRPRPSAWRGYGNEISKSEEGRSADSLRLSFGFVAHNHCRRQLDLQPRAKRRLISPTNAAGRADCPVCRNLAGCVEPNPEQCDGACLRRPKRGIANATTLSDVEIASGVKGYVRGTDHCANCWTAVAVGITGASVASHRPDHPARRDLADAIVARVGDAEVARGVNRHTIRIQRTSHRSLVRRRR